jgi:hypothetical protein
MLLGQSPAKKPKILAPHGYSISSNALKVVNETGGKVLYHFQWQQRHVATSGHRSRRRVFRYGGRGAMTLPSN